MTDECIARGMQVTQLAPQTGEKLRSFVPAYGSLLNPVDVTAAIFNNTELIGLHASGDRGRPQRRLRGDDQRLVAGRARGEGRGADRRGRFPHRQAGLHLLERA